MEMAASLPLPVSPEPTAPCKVAIFCEDSSARAKAMELSQRLLTRFGEEFVFDFGCWQLEELADPDVAGKACEAVAHADVVLVSVHRCALTDAARDFFLSCVKFRRKSGGAFALTAVDAANPPVAAHALSSALRHASRGLGMDFIPLLRLEHEGKTKPESASYAMPAGFGLDYIPNQHSHDHWGLNE